MALLKPVSPWFPITVPSDAPTGCRSPEYISFVGELSVIYIYRLKDQPSICYIGSAVPGKKWDLLDSEHIESIVPHLLEVLPINPQVASVSIVQLNCMDDHLLKLLFYLSATLVS